MLKTLKNMPLTTSVIGTERYITKGYGLSQGPRWCNYLSGVSQVAISST